MCGIIALIGTSSVVGSLVEALQRLEYRGYDSAGVATLSQERIMRVRRAGKVSALASEFRKHDLGSTIGVGHTRWATHGVPSEANAHPLMGKGHVAVVHNGIIENFQSLKQELQRRGRLFSSDTDSEVVVHLLEEYLESGMSPHEAVAQTLSKLEGTFSLVFLLRDAPDVLIGARRGSPLAIGFGAGVSALGSDALALSGIADRIAYLEDNEHIFLRLDGFRIVDAQGRSHCRRDFLPMHAERGSADKGEHRHHMHKEIFAQPPACRRLLRSLVVSGGEGFRTPFSLSGASHISLVGCGTAFYACASGRFWFEALAGISCNVEIASEFRYRVHPWQDGDFRDWPLLVVSQSGETVDTLEALRLGRSRGQQVLAVVNVEESAIARECDARLFMHAGPEFGVAATKTFTVQLLILAILALECGLSRRRMDEASYARHVASLLCLPARLGDALAGEERTIAVAEGLVGSRSVLYIGRGVFWPLALEGALKLKEVSYTHAEGFAAGEMKHGPLALIEDGTPVICLLPDGPLLTKTLSNAQEAAARGARLVCIGSSKGLEALASCGLKAETLAIPDGPALTTPMTMAVPLQLLAYHIARLKGADIDRPRNLAKSVTVE